MVGDESGARQDTPDAQAVRKIREGDDGGLEYVVREYGGRLLAVSRRITGNEADAQDCVQEALLKCYTDIDRFEGRSGLGTWLHRIVVNASLMRLRSHKRGREDSLDDMLPSFDERGMRIEEAPLAESREVEQLYEQGQTREAVRTAIDKLPDDYRAIIIARDIEQLSTAETAEVLEVSTALAKTRLHRARSALKRLLDPVVKSSAV